MATSEKVKKKLTGLPNKPGVYVMRDRSGRIIYVGKATSLRSRVRHYFQQGTLRSADPKLRSLINSIDDFEYIVVRSEADAVVTEGRLIKEHRPRYNVHFRDDKRFLLLRIHPDDPVPRFTTCRIRKNDGARYFGPYADSGVARAAMEFVEKTYGLRSCTPRVPDAEDYRHCHNDIIRFCTAPCMERIDAGAYRAKVDEACAFLEGNRREHLQMLEDEMKKAAADQRFEHAAALRDTLRMLRKAMRDRSRGLRDLAMQQEDAREGLRELQKELGLPRKPEVIECFDISNISGTHAVASMVCAVGGLPRGNRYRHFRIKTVHGIDDPAMMGEAVYRRYRRQLDEGKPLPDLLLIDGGATQLQAARDSLKALGITSLRSAGLAKKLEEVYLEPNLTDMPVRLPPDSPGLRILQRIRDEAHRFALNHHRGLRQKRIRESVLDEIEGIGEKRKELLIRHFGSVVRLGRASEAEIAAVPGVGPVLAAQIRRELDQRKGRLVEPTAAEEGESAT